MLPQRTGVPMATASRGIIVNQSCPNFEFIREFALNGLWKALTDFFCGPFEASRHIEFYWRRAESWRPFESQAAFNAYARERLADEVGYTRRRLEAHNVIARFFDKGDELKLDDVLDAVTFCSPTKPMPHAVYENLTTAIIDVTKRVGDDKFLKVEKDFLPTLIRLYPWERRDSSVIKIIPVGNSVTREFNLAILAFWFQHRNANRDEMREAVAFHSADRLDWTAKNLYSRWREGLLAERYAGRVNPLLDACVPVKAVIDGHRRTYEPLADLKPGKQALVLPLDAPDGVKK
jgi:hypothetical protein